MKPKEGSEKAPHSWDLEHWPSFVWPHSEGRARYVIRANRDELLLAGALSRVGREIVILGGPYSKWLQKKSSAVPGYEGPKQAVVRP